MSFESDLDKQYSVVHFYQLDTWNIPGIPHLNDDCVDVVHYGTMHLAWMSLYKMNPFAHIIWMTKTKVLSFK